MVVSDWSRLLVAALLVAGGAVSALWGCSSPRACDGPDDCFRGQTCRGGECRSGEAISVGSGDADGIDRRETADGSGGADARDCSAPGVRCDGAGTCRDRVDVGPERCNGRDDDCDGAVDEGCSCTYDPTERHEVDTDASHDSGVCTNQTRDKSGTCRAPVEFEPRSYVEANCDDIDNDCDGHVDEGCPCVYDPTEEAKTDTDGSHAFGVCKGQARNRSAVCQPPGNFESRTDRESRCDGEDNDCDGVVDEGCPCIYDPSDPNNIDDDPGAPCHETSNACGVCKDQRIDENGLCTKPDAYESKESSCSDGLDNDCDSFVDATGDNKDFDCP